MDDYIQLPTSIELNLYAKSFDKEHHFSRSLVHPSYPIPACGDKLHLRPLHDNKWYYGNVVDRVFDYEHGELIGVNLRIENLVIINLNPSLSEAEIAMAQEIANEIAERKRNGNLESNS